jgi:hypothetical protein
LIISKGETKAGILCGIAIVIALKLILKIGAWEASLSPPASGFGERADAAFLESEEHREPNSVATFFGRGTKRAPDLVGIARKRNCGRFNEGLAVRK